MTRVSLHSSVGEVVGNVERSPCACSSSSSEEFSAEEEVEEGAAMPFSPRVRPFMSSSSELSGCTVTS